MKHFHKIDNNMNYISNPDPITKETKKRFKSKQPWHNDFENKNSSDHGGFFFLKVLNQNLIGLYL